MRAHLACCCCGRPNVGFLLKGGCARTIAPNASNKIHSNLEKHRKMNGEEQDGSAGVLLTMTRVYKDAIRSDAPIPFRTRRAICYLFLLFFLFDGRSNADFFLLRCTLSVNCISLFPRLFPVLPSRPSPAPTFPSVRPQGNRAVVKPSAVWGLHCYYLATS